MWMCHVPVSSLWADFCMLTEYSQGCIHHSFIKLMPNLKHIFLWRNDCIWEEITLQSLCANQKRNLEFLCGLYVRFWLKDTKKIPGECSLCQGFELNILKKDWEDFQNAFDHQIFFQYVTMNHLFFLNYGVSNPHECENQKISKQWSHLFSTQI